MEPAEEIVTSWLYQKHYFTMNEIKVSYYNKEIDILAINPVTGKKSHVEVHVSIRPAASLRAWAHIRYSKEPLEQRIRCFCLSKFIGAVDEKTKKLKKRKNGTEITCVEDKVKKLFNSDDYEKILVVGNLHRADQKDELEKELAKHGVRLVLLEKILQEMVTNMDAIYMGNARRYLQILSTLNRKSLSETKIQK